MARQTIVPALGTLRVTARAVDDTFIRADADADGRVNIADAVSTLGFLFQGDAQLQCVAAADTNDDGRINLTDALHTLNYLFQGGAVIPAPFPDCGSDASTGGLECPGFTACR